MPTVDCWLCWTLPAHMTQELWQERCRCGGTLAVHALRHPHPIPLVECRGFTRDAARQTPEPDAQPALF
jgi:hypothetical protein